MLPNDRGGRPFANENKVHTSHVKSCTKCKIDSGERNLSFEIERTTHVRNDRFVRLENDGADADGAAMRWARPPPGRETNGSLPTTCGNARRMTALETLVRNLSNLTLVPRSLCTGS